MVVNILSCSACRHNRRRTVRTYYLLLTPYYFEKEVLPREQYGAVRGRRRPEAGDAATGEHRRADGDELVRGVSELRTRLAPHVRPEARRDLPAEREGAFQKDLRHRIVGVRQVPRADEPRARRHLVGMRLVRGDGHEAIAARYVLVC